MALHGFGAPAPALDGKCGKLIVVTEQPRDKASFGCSVPPADGCLSLPLDEHEVLSCVGAALRGQRDDADETWRAPGVLSFDGFTIGLAGRSLLDCDGSEVPLTRSEFALLVVLARRAGCRVINCSMRRWAEGFDTPDLKDAKALIDELT